MNDNICKILVQCKEESIDGPGYPDWVDQEKFADLIIKKCVSIVNTWSEEEPCSEGYDIMSVYRIKEYFGVNDDE